MPLINKIVSQSYLFSQLLKSSFLQKDANQRLPPKVYDSEAFTRMTTVLKVLQFVVKVLQDNCYTIH